MKRLSATPCCRSVAVEVAIVSEDTPCLRRAAMGAVLGAVAADRTAIPHAHPSSGREQSEAASSQAPDRSQRPKCRRSLIPLLVLFPREPLRLRSRGSPVATWGYPGPKPKAKKFLFHRPRRIFFFKENGGRQIPHRFRGGKIASPEMVESSRQVCQHSAANRRLPGKQNYI